MRSIPSREWLAVSLPLLFGLILLGAGAVAADDDGAWIPYTLAAIAGAAVPVAYTLELIREHRLFLRDSLTVARSRARMSVLILFGWLLGAGLLIVAAGISGSGKALFYALLGGVAIGLWPGLLANFIRLWREQWRGTLGPTRKP
jgi:hypothetical protein